MQQIHLQGMSYDLESISLYCWIQIFRSPPPRVNRQQGTANKGEVTPALSRAICGFSWCVVYDSYFFKDIGHFW